MDNNIMADSKYIKNYYCKKCDKTFNFGFDIFDYAFKHYNNDDHSDLICHK